MKLIFAFTTLLVSMAASATTIDQVLTANHGQLTGKAADGSACTVKTNLPNEVTGEAYYSTTLQFANNVIAPISYPFISRQVTSQLWKIDEAKHVITFDQDVSGFGQDFGHYIISFTYDPSTLKFLTGFYSQKYYYPLDHTCAF